MFLLGVRELGLSGHIIWSKRKRKKAYFLSKQSGYQVPGTILYYLVSTKQRVTGFKNKKPRQVEDV